MEAELLQALHAHASPPLDLIFLISHYLGSLFFVVALVVTVAGLLAVFGKRRWALIWVLTGLSTAALNYGLKPAFGRVRPALWVGPVSHTSFAFPSGHALSAATFFPMLAAMAAARWPQQRRLLLAVGIGFTFYVGFGRLYLGVHWPTDVLAGWTLGAVQATLAIRAMRPATPAPA